jgi:hypothetical protein
MMPAMIKTQSDWSSGARHASQEICQDMSEYGRHLMEAKSNRLKQQYNHFSNDLGPIKKYERSISTGVPRRDLSVPRGIKPAVRESCQFKIQKTSATLIPKTQSPNGSQSSIKGFRRRNSSHTSTKKVPQIKPPIDRKYVRNVMAI